ncbi:30S ribosomal protein S6 [Mycoplasma marinum]|nr:30S ribosomal protein S6 [Mycoplasma marinum]
MAKYEIMLVLDPKADSSIIEKQSKEVFGGAASVKKLEITDLAYEINKSNTGQFFLLSVETEGSNIQEWNRRSNIVKEIWRNLVINLDNEAGYNKPFVENKFSKYPRLRKKQAERKAAMEARRAERAAYLARQNASKPEDK